jgi:hypothetical protein
MNLGFVGTGSTTSDTGALAAVSDALNAVLQRMKPAP